MGLGQVLNLTSQLVGLRSPQHEKHRFEAVGQALESQPIVLTQESVTRGDVRCKLLQAVGLVGQEKSLISIKKLLNRKQLLIARGWWRLDLIWFCRDG